MFIAEYSEYLEEGGYFCIETLLSSVPVGPVGSRVVAALKANDTIFLLWNKKWSWCIGDTSAPRNN